MTTQRPHPPTNGITPYCFNVKTEDEDLLCGRCHQTWAKPVELKPCKHIQCRGCTQGTTHCFTCKQEFTETVLPHPLLVKTANKVIVQCEDCGLQMSRLDSYAHHCAPPVDGTGQRAVQPPAEASPSQVHVEQDLSREVRTQAAATASARSIPADPPQQLPQPPQQREPAQVELPSVAVFPSAPPAVTPTPTVAPDPPLELPSTQFKPSSGQPQQQQLQPQALQSSHQTAPAAARVGRRFGSVPAPAVAQSPARAEQNVTGRPVVASTTENEYHATTVRLPFSAGNRTSVVPPGPSLGNFRLSNPSSIDAPRAQGFRGSARATHAAAARADDFASTRAAAASASASMLGSSSVSLAAPN